MEISFCTIENFAFRNFNSWENGEDYHWLKKEWLKYKNHLNDTREAEDFILTLAYIYFVFCNESYFYKSSQNILSINEYVNEFKKGHPEFTERINDKFNFTIDLLLEVYKRPSEFLRELVSIAIDFEIPHQNGYKFIHDLFKDKIKEPENNIPF